MAKKNYDLLFKLMFVGDTNVGKTAIILRYSDNTFRPSLTPTLGIDFRVKTITLRGTIIKLQIWDTAGQVNLNIFTLLSVDN